MRVRRAFQVDDKPKQQERARSHVHAETKGAAEGKAAASDKRFGSSQSRPLFGPAGPCAVTSSMNGHDVRSGTS
jgi:hypothetical protein